MNTKQEAPKGAQKVTIAESQKSNEKLTPAQKKEANETIKSILEPNASPEQRLSKLKVLNEISKKVEYLRKTKEDFDLFLASYDGTSSKVTLENSQGFKFSVSNTQTLSKVFEVIGTDLNAIKEKAEQEFTAFQI